MNSSLPNHGDTLFSKVWQALEKKNIHIHIFRMYPNFQTYIMNCKAAKYPYCYQLLHNDPMENVSCPKTKLIYIGVIL